MTLIAADIIEAPDTRVPLDFRAANIDVTAEPIRLDAARAMRDREAWRFSITLPGDARLRAITVSGYLADDPTVTLKRVIASLMQPAPKELFSR